MANWPPNPLLETDTVGPVPRANVSIKISSLSARTDAIDFDGSLGALSEALGPILEAAARRQVLVNFDMEQAALKDLTLALFQRCSEAYDFPAGLALQAYLRSGMDDAAADHRLVAAERAASDRAVDQGRLLGLRSNQRRADGLARARLDRQARNRRLFRADGRAVSWPRCRGSSGEGGVKLAIGSHNVRSIAHALAVLEQHDLPPSAIEVQQLYGMADQLRSAIVGRGLRLRQYVPLGEMIPGMAYLVRRLLENTSNQSWLRAGFFDEASDEELLASPHDAQDGLAAATDGQNCVAAAGTDAQESLAAVGKDPQNRLAAAGTGPQSCLAAAGTAARRHALSPAVEGLGDGLPMVNEPLRDFAQAGLRHQFARAIASVRSPHGAGRLPCRTGPASRRRGRGGLSRLARPRSA